MKNEEFLKWNYVWKYVWGKYVWRDNKVFCSTTLQPLQFECEQKETCGNENNEKENKHNHASAADLLHIRIKNLDWCKFRNCKNETREIDCLCCKEVDGKLIASAKNLGSWGKHITIQLSAIHLASAQLLVTCVSLNCQVNEFFFCSQCSWTK